VPKVARLAVEVLGRPSVAVDKMPVPLSPRQLAAVVRLALARHRPTSAPRMLSAWPEGTGSDGALRVMLTRLRPMLTPAQITRVEGGYVLNPNAELDADRFEELLRAARDGTDDLERRLTSIDRALGLWQGPAFDGLTDLDWARHEACRLDELHEQARDLRYELMLGRAAAQGAAAGYETVLPELSAECVRTPGREHRAGLLATALYCAGRQGDALEVLAGVRRHLRDELGLSPGRALDELELRILNHDPRLAAGAAALHSHPAIDRQLTAARALLREGAPLAAEPIADAALGSARSHGHRGQLVAALLLAAEIAVSTGSRPIEPLVDEAQSLARVIGAPELLAQTALARFARGIPSDWKASLVDLTEPLAGLPPAAGVRVELLAAAAALLAFSGEHSATEQLLHAAEDTHRAIGSRHSESVWLATRSIVSDVSDSRRAIADATRAVDLALLTGDPRLVVVAIHAVLKVGWACAALDAVEAVLEPLEEHSRRAGIVFGRVRVHIAAGALALARGDLAAASVEVEATRSVGAQLGGHAAAPAAYWQEIQLALERGESATLLATLRNLPFDPRNGVSPIALAAALGDAEDLARLRATYRQVTAGDTNALQMALIARAAAEHSDAELAEFCAPALARLGAHVVLHGFGSVVLGPAPLFLGLARAGQGKWHDAAESFTSAAAIAERAGAGLWLAEARSWLARAHAELGDAEQAVRTLIGTQIDTGWVRIREVARRAEALTTQVPARR
jgi:DNA-binding SARP family transcriptional activator